MKNPLFLFLVLFVSLFLQQTLGQDAVPFSMEGRKVSVFTTASGTDMKLSHSGDLAFEAASQPFENEIAVFVNPDKKFQTLLGIGGALTDASAEVFARLPEEKQQDRSREEDIQPEQVVPWIRQSGDTP